MLQNQGKEDHVRGVNVHFLVQLSFENFGSCDLPCHADEAGERHLVLVDCTSLGSELVKNKYSKKLSQFRKLEGLRALSSWKVSFVILAPFAKSRWVSKNPSLQIRGGNQALKELGAFQQLLERMRMTEL